MHHGSLDGAIRETGAAESASRTAQKRLGIEHQQIGAHPVRRDRVHQPGLAAEGAEHHHVVAVGQHRAERRDDVVRRVGGRHGDEIDVADRVGVAARQAAVQEHAVDAVRRGEAGGEPVQYRVPPGHRAQSITVNAPPSAARLDPWWHREGVRRKRWRARKDSNLRPPGSKSSVRNAGRRTLAVSQRPVFRFNWVQWPLRPAFRLGCRIGNRKTMVAARALSRKVRPYTIAAGVASDNASSLTGHRCPASPVVGIRESPATAGVRRVERSNGCGSELASAPTARSDRVEACACGTTPLVFPKRRGARIGLLPARTRSARQLPGPIRVLS